MNKSDLIKAITESGLSKKDAETALNTTLTAISEALSKGESVQLIGFGTFSVKERPEREARNPRTGETIKVAASKVPSFKPGKALKDKVK